MLEALVANKLQGRVRFFCWLDSGEPQRRLVRAAEEVVEARGGERMHGAGQDKRVLRQNRTWQLLVRKASWRLKYR